MSSGEAIPSTLTRGAPRTTLLVLCAGVTVISTAAGCVKSLFPSDMPRNQFETHDRMRQAYTPLEEPDVFGTPQPALRARLTQPQQ
ncbi:MAG: hypothetical protein ACKO3W_04750 [bacterium]